MPMLDARLIAMWSLIMIGVFEGVTLLLRFAFGLSATIHTASVGARLTGGIRIHHGYLGILVAVAVIATWHAYPAASRWMLALAIALVCSDLIHHFVILWAITGSPEFDLLYPR